jgi:putative oxidoreductase
MHRNLQLKGTLVYLKYRCYASKYIGFHDETSEFKIHSMPPTDGQPKSKHEGQAMKTMTHNTTAIIGAIGRVLLAMIFIFSAYGKLVAPASAIGYIQSVGLPFATLGFAIAVAIELGGGLLLVLGMKTRIVAAVLAIFSIATALVFHHAFGDQNQLMHFMKNIAMAGGLLQLTAFGAGALSIDARTRHHVTSTAT